MIIHWFGDTESKRLGTTDLGQTVRVKPGHETLVKSTHMGWRAFGKKAMY